MSEIIFTQRPDLNVRTIDLETVIVDKDSGEVHQLNPTASYIWEQFDGNTSIEQVIERVAGMFDISAEQASADVNAVVEQFKTLSLLVCAE